MLFGDKILSFYRQWFLFCVALWFSKQCMLPDAFDCKGVAFNSTRLLCKPNLYTLPDPFFPPKLISSVIAAIFCILGALINLKIKLVELIIKQR